MHIVEKDTSRFWRRIDSEYLQCLNDRLLEAR